MSSGRPAKYKSIASIKQIAILGIKQVKECQIWRIGWILQQNVIQFSLFSNCQNTFVGLCIIMMEGSFFGLQSFFYSVPFLSKIPRGSFIIILCIFSTYSSVLAFIEQLKRTFQRNTDNSFILNSCISNTIN